MIYSNDDPMALLAMEAERTGNYGDYDDSGAERCPVCNTCDPEYFYLDDDRECIGCSECIHRTDTLF